jgi:hypothetical protein
MRCKELRQCLPKDYNGEHDSVDRVLEEVYPQGLQTVQFVQLAEVLHHKFIDHHQKKHDLVPMPLFNMPGLISDTHKSQPQTVW